HSLLARVRPGLRRGLGISSKEVFPYWLAFARGLRRDPGISSQEVFPHGLEFFLRDSFNGSQSLLVSFFLSLLFLLERKSKQKVQGRHDRSARASGPRHNSHSKLVSKKRYAKRSGLHRM